MEKHSDHFSLPNSKAEDFAQALSTEAFGELTKEHGRAARNLFGNQLGDLKFVDLYTPDGNFDSLKGDLLFRSKTSIRNSDLEDCLKSQNLSSLGLILSRVRFMSDFLAAFYFSA